MQGKAAQAASKMEQGIGAEGRPGEPPALGVLHYAMMFWWLFIAFAGWAISLGSLSSLQHKTNSRGNAEDFAINANYPFLPNGRIYRFDWFTLFAQLVVLVVVVLALASAALARTRGMLLSWLAVICTLQIISADRMYNVSHFGNILTSGQFHSARAAFAGYIISAIGDFCLMYHIGIVP